MDGFAQRQKKPRPGRGFGNKLMRLDSYPTMEVLARTSTSLSP